MDISCSSCKAKFKLPDEKVPKGQAFTIPCPKCKKKITVNVKGPGKPPDSPGKATGEPDKKAPERKPDKKPDKASDKASKPGKKPDKTLIEQAAADYDSADKPFDFVEEGVETALVCEADPAINAGITEVLEKMGYVVTSPKNPMEALKQMRFYNFNLVLLNERFGTSNPDENHVRKYLDRLAMESRRKIFVVLLTGRFRTNDNMVAFNKSVNLVINGKDMGQLRKVLAAAISEHSTFYRIFKDTMVNVGKV